MNKDGNSTGRTIRAWLLGLAGFMAFAVGADEQPLTGLKNYQVTTPALQRDISFKNLEQELQEHCLVAHLQVKVKKKLQKLLEIPTV